MADEDRDLAAARELVRVFDEVHTYKERRVYQFTDKYSGAGVRVMVERITPIKQEALKGPKEHIFSGNPLEAFSDIFGTLQGRKS